jgi:hypothetical protein
VGQGVLPGASVMPKPACERLDRANVMVDRLQAQSSFSEGGQGGLNTGRGQVDQPGGVQVLGDGPIDHRPHMAGRTGGGGCDHFQSGTADQRHEPGNAPAGHVGMGRGVALPNQERAPVGQVPRQGPTLVVTVSVRLAVDHAATSQLGLGFQLAGHRLGRRLVGTSLHRPLDAVLVGIGDVP